MNFKKIEMDHYKRKSHFDYILIVWLFPMWAQL